MKNKLLSLGLVAGFSLVTLASCSDYNDYLKWKNSDNQVVLTVDGKEVTIDDLLKDYKTTNSTGIEAYYNAISEVLVRQSTKNYAKSTELLNYVEQKVKNFKEDAKEKADTNGTSYKEELNSALSSESCDDLDEYRDKVTYDKLKEHLEDDYYDTKTDDMLDGYIDEVLPYHVRHILVNVSASSTDIANATITETEAANLASVVRRIGNVDSKGNARATTESFGAVAFDASEDDTSAAQYGDLGIMSTKTSFVNEFKLGIYAYEALYSQTSSPRVSLLTNNDTDPDMADLKANTYAIPADAQADVSSRNETVKTMADWSTVSASSTTADLTTEITRRKDGIGYIPFEYTQMLEQYKADTKTTSGKLVNDGDANYYPRNIIYSTFFNDHGINVITNTAEVGNFKIIDGLFDNQPVLCADGDTNKVVLVTRAGSSYQGVHFMVIEKSAIASTKEELENYYDDRTATELKADGEESKIGSTYVTYLDSTLSETQKTRSDTVEEEIKGYDSMLDATIFEALMDGSYVPTDETYTQVKISDTTIAAKIDTYLSAERINTKMNSISTNEDSWIAYTDLLKIQDTEVEADRLSLLCAFKFAYGYTEGDGCYYEK